MLQLVFKSLSSNLPTSEFDLMEGCDHKIGFIQIRHQPSHSEGLPAHMANHIYYEIDPIFRGKGYGKKILTLGLAEAKKIGLREVMIVCAEDNIASKKIIEASGGIFMEDAQSSDGRKHLKYKIVLK